MIAQMSASWRIALRMARREAVHAKGRTALVALMVAVPVLGASAVSVVFRSQHVDLATYTQLQLGSQAQAMVTQVQPGAHFTQSVDAQTASSAGGHDTPSPTQQQALAHVTKQLPRYRITPITSYPLDSVRVRDQLLRNLVLTEFDTSDPAAAELATNLDGRMPHTDSEVVLAGRLRYRDDLHVGDTLRVPVNSLTVNGAAQANTVPTPTHYPAAERTFTIVGKANYQNNSNDTLITVPQALVPAAKRQQMDSGNTQYLLSGGAPITWSRVTELNTQGLVVLAREATLHPPATSAATSSQSTAVRAALIVAAGLVLLQVILMVGPAMAVGARRQQRSLALLASVGAPQPHLRLVIVTQALLAGFVGSLIGTIAGFGVGAVTVQWFSSRGLLYAPRITFAALDLLVFLALGVFTALAAAAIPAWQTARVPVIAGLRGRIGPRRPSPALTTLGMVVVVGSTVVALAGGAKGSYALVLVGIAGTEIGFILMVGMAVALIAKTAQVLPLSGRMALRDAARNRNRTTPAVAAVMAAIAGCTTVSLFTAASDTRDQALYQPMVPIGTVLATDTYSQPKPRDWTAAQASLRSQLPVNDIATVHVMYSAQENQQLEIQNNPQCPDMMANYNHGSPQQCWRTTKTNYQGLPGSGYLADDGTALPLLTGSTDAAAQKALGSGTAVVMNPAMLWPDNTVRVKVNAGQSQQTVSLPALLWHGNATIGDMTTNGVVFPLSSVTKLGMAQRQLGLVATTIRPVTDAELERANATVSVKIPDAQVHAERGFHSSTGIALLIVVGIGAFIALVGTLTATALTSAEGRADRSTLAAIGAPSGIRRRLQAANAAVIAILGSGLGVITGGLAGYIIVRIRQLGERNLAVSDQHWQFVIPWTPLLVLALGVPALAIAIAWISTRSRLTMVRRVAD